jgi:hypothetical protein
MALAVETPAPPDVTNRSLPAAVDPETIVDATSELRRGELEAALRAGAWDDAFGEWADYTDLSEAEYTAIHDAGLIEGLDIYWHPDEASIEFELPSIPDTVGGDKEFGARATSELTDLGETVTKVLEDGYIAWDEPDIDEEEPEEL